MYSKILAPLDGSKLSECSLEHVKAIAKGCQVPEVVLLTVVEADRSIFPEYGSESTIKEAAKQMQAQLNEARKKAEDYMAKAAANLKSAGIAAQTVVITSEVINGAVDGILDFARKNKVDLIVMSTHGRSGITRWAFGSVTDRVIREAKMPVLTVTPAGCRA